MCSKWLTSPLVALPALDVAARRVFPPKSHLRLRGPVRSLEKKGRCIYKTFNIHSRDYPVSSHCLSQTEESVQLFGLSDGLWPVC